VRGISTGAFVEERDDWALAVARARREKWECLELCAIVPPLLASLTAHLADATIEGFARVSLHAPVGITSVAAVVSSVLELPLDGDIVLHPDIYGDDASVSHLGGRAMFENMDIAKTFGRTVEDVGTVLDRFPDSGFCLDVAHVWTNDPTLALGHNLIDAFGSRLRQLHVSGIEPDGTHRETTPADLELYRPLLERCGGTPQVFEAVIV